MKKRYARNIISLLSSTLIVFWVINLNYDDLSWKENTAAYLGIGAMILLLVGMIISNKKKSEGH